MGFSNRTTRHLAGYARQRGLDVGVLFSPGNAAGRYFITSREGTALTHWISLGWTQVEAEEKLCDMAEEVSDVQPNGLA